MADAHTICARFCSLIVLGSAYLLLGFLYQRYVAGAKGLEQIPNYDFWRDCGSLQAVSHDSLLITYLRASLLMTWVPHRTRVIKINNQLIFLTMIFIDFSGRAFLFCSRLFFCFVLYAFDYFKSQREIISLIEGKGVHPP